MVVVRVCCLHSDNSNLVIFISTFADWSWILIKRAKISHFNSTKNQFLIIGLVNLSIVEEVFV